MLQQKYIASESQMISVADTSVDLTGMTRKIYEAIVNVAVSLKNCDTLPVFHLFKFVDGTPNYEEKIPKPKTTIKKLSNYNV